MELVMKTRINIMLALLTLIAVGCAKEQPAGETQNAIAEGRTIVVNMPEMTKTALGEATQTGVAVVWSAGDEIAVIEGKGTDAQKVFTYRLVGESGTAAGTFECVSGDAAAEVITDIVFPASAVENGYAVPTSQTYVEGSFDTDAMVMSWTRSAEEENITLAHEASALMFTVTGTAEQKISSVAVECGEKTYTLACAEPVALTSEGVVFYVAVPGSETSQDYVVTFTAEGGETLTKDFTFALAAGKIGRLPAFTFETAPATLLQVGDYFGGGFIYEIGDGYVKVVSLDEASLAWSASTTHMGTEANAAEGAANTDLFRDREDLEDFPAMAWCIAKGEGWYMPSRAEINDIVNGLGISASTIDAVNEKFVEYYGHGFVSGKAYHTSCEHATDGSKNWTVTIPNKSHNSYGKGTARPVRAVKKIALVGGETADPKPEKPIEQQIAVIADATHTNTNSNYYSGTNDYIYVYYSTSGDLRRAGYFQLDISSLEVEKVVSASLNLSIYKNKCDFYDFESLTFNAYKVDNGWEEVNYTSSLGSKKGTWTTSIAVAASTTILPTAEKLEFDLTECIKTALKNDETVISICIQSPNTNYKNVDGTKTSAKLYLYSRESSVAGVQPYLLVTAFK